jgi:hypothetical protein
MGNKARILGIVFFVSFEPSQCYSQAAKGYVSATDAQVAVCNQAHSNPVKADCDNLALEFNKDKTAQSPSGLKPSLVEPFTNLSPFIFEIRQRAFERAAGLALKKDLSPIVQAALNSAAQALSTKTAVTQTGASSGSSGSTNLVAKPTTTDLISLAAESGAFKDTVNGNSLTAQANVEGLRRYITGKPFADLSPPTIDILNHINLTATFSVAQSGSTGVSTSGSATAATPSIASIILPSNNLSFNSLSVNFTLLRRYNPRSQAFVTSWKAAVAKNAASLASAITSVEVAVLNVSPLRLKAAADPDFIEAQKAWISAAKSDEISDDFPKFVTDYATFANAYEAALEKADPSNVYTNILSVNTALQEITDVNDSILNEARGKPLLTLGYTYSTPQGKPATHTATLAGAYVFHGWNGAQLTGNAAGSWFASVPAGAVYGSVQSYQFSGEYDQPIGSATAPRATFSLAGYGQYQYNPTVLNITSANLVPGTNITLPNNAQVLLGTAGWLGVAQAKLVFNVGKGLSIPVAVKWSNKTDLIQTGNWKGQFGISYDLSALSSMLTGKN